MKRRMEAAEAKAAALEAENARLKAQLASTKTGTSTAAAPPAAKRAKGGMAAADAAAAAAAAQPTGPELLVYRAQDMQKVGDDMVMWTKYDSASGVTIWRPVVGRDGFWFGHVAVLDCHSKPDCSNWGRPSKAKSCPRAWVAKPGPGPGAAELPPAAKGKENGGVSPSGRLPPLAKPVSCGIHEPVPPPGYVALGCLALFRKNGGREDPKPAEVKNLMTVRADLAVAARMGEGLWYESHGTEFDGALTEVTPNGNGLDMGTFWGSMQQDDIVNNAKLQAQARTLARARVEVDADDAAKPAEEAESESGEDDCFEDEDEDEYEDGGWEREYDESDSDGSPRDAVRWRRTF